MPHIIAARVRMLTIAALISAAAVALAAATSATEPTIPGCSSAYPTPYEGAEATQAPLVTACAPAMPPGGPIPSVGPAASPTATPAVMATVDVQAKDLYFVPAKITLRAHGATRLVFSNGGYVGHNLTVDELGIQIVASRGGSDETVLVDPPAGSYTFYCSVSGHRDAGMEGIFLVE